MNKLHFIIWPREKDVRQIFSQAYKPPWIPVYPTTREPLPEGLYSNPSVYLGIDSQLHLRHLNYIYLNLLQHF